VEKKELTCEQLAALRNYAAVHGRTWKSKLNWAWMTGNYGIGDASGPLQQIRNTFGPTWLTRFKMPPEKGL